MASIIQKINAVRNVVFLIVSLLYLIAMGCDSMLTRHAPSKDSYIELYLKKIDKSQIIKIDYVYKGEIGGVFTVARVQFKSPVIIKAKLEEVNNKDINPTIDTYDPLNMSESDKLILKHQLTIVTDGKMPPWLDFPFNQKMRIITESFDGNIDKGKPRYDRKWYIDDKTNVVYFCGSWG
jgi:hypothetical protein